MQSVARIALLAMILSAASGIAFCDDESAFMLIPGPGHDWLVVEKLQARDGRGLGEDSGLIQGFFNLPPAILSPDVADVTISVDEWSLTIPAAAWKKVGRGTSYMARSSEYMAKIDYWVRGSSLCKFRFSLRKQHLKDNAPNFPVLPLRLQITPAFDETLQVLMQDLRNGAKMSEWPDLFASPRSCIVTLHPTRTGFDGFKLSGWIVAEDFDPAVNGIEMLVGPYHVVIPPGALVVRNPNVITYQQNLAGGERLSLLIQPKKSFFTLQVRKADLTGLTNPMPLYILLQGVPGGEWMFELNLSENRPGTVLKY